MSEAYVIAAETISDGHRVPAQRSAPVATKSCRCRRDFGAETLLGTDRSLRIGMQPEIPFEYRICRAGPSAPFAALTLRPTSAAMWPIDVSRSQPPPLLPG